MDDRSKLTRAIQKGLKKVKITLVNRGRAKNYQPNKGRFLLKLRMVIRLKVWPVDVLSARKKQHKITLGRPRIISSKTTHKVSILHRTYSD